jgi:NAD(P)-dependent dehydrogenase (short-subunit alcohol dehydrogenase family)
MVDRTRVLVTGCSSGFGAATVRALVAGDFAVVAGIRDSHTRNAAAAAALREAAVGPGTLDIIDLDVTSDASVDAAVAAAGEVDVLVNNAGTGVDEPFIEQSLDQWQHVIATNLTGPFVAGQRAAQRMVDSGRKGVIVNITSVHEHIPKSGAAAYCASKGGLGLLTKVMALELAQHGIRVNSIAPGEISTPMTGQHEEDPAQQDREGDIPLARPGHAYEIGRWVAFLASDDASYATGASFVVDGGLMLMAAEMG